jgi:hypothetical protein
MEWNYAYNLPFLKTPKQTIVRKKKSTMTRTLQQQLT